MRLIPWIGFVRWVGIGRHVVEGQGGNREGVGRMKVHILAKTVGIEEEAALQTRF